MLTFLFQGPTKAEPPCCCSKLVHWVQRLSAFDLDVQYIRSLDNVVADALSRLPLPSSGYALPDISHDVTLKRIVGDGVTITELQEVSARDDTLQAVLHFVRAQWPLKQQVPANLLPYYHTRNELHIEHNCLVCDCCFIAPVELCKRILGLAHVGHPGVTRMRRKLREVYWWPGLNLEVFELVSKCTGCQFSEKTTPPAKVPIISIPKPTKSWAVNEHDYVSLVRRRIKEWARDVNALTTDICTNCITRWLETIFSVFGNPQECVSDNSPQFMSVDFANFLKKHGVQHI